MSIGFFFNTMYNVVDSFYAGKISTDALAALALSFPIFFIIISIAEGIARGASALIANAIGANDTSKERAYSSQVFTLGAIFAVILTTTGFFIAEPLFRLLGASGDYLQLAKNYISPLFLGAGFFILSSICNAILLANGDGKTFGKVLVAGFFLNLILDPWFLYGGLGVPAMGIKGISWATVIIQILSSLFLLSVVLKRGYLTSCTIKNFSPDIRICTDILKQGIPASFNMMSIALGFFVTTYYLKFYGEAAVAAFGIGTRIEQIALLPSIGLNSAIISIVGQNNGAGQFDRVRACYYLCIRYGLYLIITGSILLYAFADQLISFFTSDPEVLEVGGDLVRIVSFTQWAYVMGFICVGFLQAVKRPMYSFVESLIRKAILPLSIFPLIVGVYHVQLTTFWWAGVAINILMAIVSLTYARHMLHKIITTNNTQPAPIDD